MKDYRSICLIKEWLNQLADNRIIYESNFIVICRMEQIETCDDFFKVHLVRETIVRAPPVVRRGKRDATEFYKNNLIEWDVVINWKYCGIDEQQKILRASAYSGFSLWLNPEIIQKVDYWMKNNQTETAISQIIDFNLDETKLLSEKGTRNIRN